MFHYTDDDGFKAIRSQPVWVFKVSKPPGEHPAGAYFTILDPSTPNLAKRLRVPRTKLSFVFCFADGSDLLPLEGGRGAYIFYSPVDYHVEESRQVDHGSREEVLSRLS